MIENVYFNFHILNTAFLSCKTRDKTVERKVKFALFERFPCL